MARIDSHLAECDECRKRLLPEDQLSQAVAKLYRRIYANLPPDCTTYDLLASYVDGQLDEEEKKRVEEHFKVCSRCAEDLRSLEEFRMALQKQPKRLPVPTATKPNWWQWLQNALTSQWLLTLEGVAILLLIALYAFHQSQQRLTGQLQQVTFQLSHLHEHIKRLQGQVQAMQNERLADLQKQLETVQRRLEGISQAQGRAVPHKLILPLMALKDTAGTVVLTADRKLQMQVPLAIEWRKRVLELLVEGKVSQPENVKIAMAKVSEKVIVRGEAKETKTVQLVSPVMTSVFPDRIVFQWEGTKDATQYRILIADEIGTKVLWESQPTTKTSLTLPAHVLKPGAIYTWQVEAVVGDEKVVSKPARFWVLDKRSAQIVRKMERRFSHSALTLATVYATYGLRDEALAQINRLQKQNPSHPAIRLLRDAVSKSLSPKGSSPDAS